MKTIEIPVYDGSVGCTTVIISLGEVARFTVTDARAGTCWHISDPKAAKKLRKLLKPLADQA